MLLLQSRTHRQMPFVNSYIKQSVAILELHYITNLHKIFHMWMILLIHVLLLHQMHLKQQFIAHWIFEQVHWFFTEAWYWKFYLLEIYNYFINFNKPLLINNFDVETCIADMLTCAGQQVYCRKKKQATEEGI